MEVTKDLSTNIHFYSNAEEYWNTASATVDGMLGGFEKVSAVDLLVSTKLISNLLNTNILKKTHDKALDCGAGIGRVTKNVLMQFFNSVDMVELTERFLDESYRYIGSTDKNISRICSPLQMFSPIEKGYDLIWCQWVTGHLTDVDLTNFLKRCILGLHSKDSLIIIKDNVISEEEPEFDSVDSSFIRPITTIEDIINNAGLELIIKEQQTHFPIEVYPVWMFVMKSTKNILL